MAYFHGIIYVAQGGQTLEVLTLQGDALTSGDGDGPWSRKETFNVTTRWHFFLAASLASSLTVLGHGIKPCCLSKQEILHKV